MSKLTTKQIEKIKEALPHVSEWPHERITFDYTPDMPAPTLSPCKNCKGDHIKYIQLSFVKKTGFGGVEWELDEQFKSFSDFIGGTSPL